MTSLREEFKQAVRALESAYLADKIAYVGLNRRSKDFWALQPPKSWPTGADFAPWLHARTRLLTAEARVIELLRRRCEEIKERRKRRLARRSVACAPYLEQIVETVPDDLGLANFFTLKTAEAPALTPFLRVH
ncbi:hypothetical protein QTI66_08575 [Variovorax sp. J22R133]|uniref:hypothetical protein n=1 Tax=Variovorax brevis TaxID=3053503 RepID=UPI0025782A34|nr:hypothetical protein [Variovorax sp. J22R133]MDM0112202.1 hypothetical protein [Variovorax sp. J22R133]